jgi:hypothetical protein
MIFGMKNIGANNFNQGGRYDLKRGTVQKNY